VLALLLASCGGRAVQQPPPATPAAPAVVVGQVGMASFYSSSLAGHRTASGERYDPHALTAAHRSLPLGTLLRVTRLDPTGAPVGHPVVVKVNDRGPYAAGRILDLSLEAARRLGMLRAGVVRVRIEVVGR
jgi:rare lipoprotein A